MFITPLGEDGRMSTLLVPLLVVVCVFVSGSRLHCKQIHAAGKQTPRLIVSHGETIIASAVVTSPPYKADKTGRRDATAAIQKALDDVGRMGGGVVFVPAGRYRIEGRLRLPYSTTLHGEWLSPGLGGLGKGTILLAYSGRGDTSGQALVESMATETGLIGIGVWYPEQKASRIKPYPPSVAGMPMTLRNITFYNAYQAVRFESVNGAVVENVFGTVLKQGIVAPESTEVSWLRDVHFSNKYWREAARALVGTDFSESEGRFLDQFTHENLVGLELGRIDGMAIYGFSVEDAQTAALMRKNEKYPHPVFGFGGVVSQFTGSRKEIGWAPWYYWMHYANVDNVPEARDKRYWFAAIPSAKSVGPGSLIVVTSPPYKARGDGVTDDTAAIRAALRDAGKRGGGIVYLPQGEYKITRPLVVPSGVELRGSLGTVRLREYVETCTLAAHFGANTPKPETDNALITLMDNSGIRGLTIAHPLQSCDPSLLRPYPYTIRGRGKRIWIADVSLLNSYLGIDLATYRCDEHVVVGVWGTVLKKGIDVGGGSRNGRIERLAFSYGTLTESGRFASRLSGELRKAIADYTFHNAVHYSFGDCEGERAWGLFGFYPSVHCRFYKSKDQGCVNAELWQSIHDGAGKANLLVEGGESIGVLGYFGTGDVGTSNNWLEIGPDFAGHLNVFAPMINTQGRPLDSAPGRVRVYEEASLVTGKKASSDRSLPESSPYNAIDGDPTTLWEAPPGSWLQVDLGAVRTINRCRVQSAGMRMAKEFNLLEAELQVGLDAQSFTSACTLRPDGYLFADIPVEPVQARYVRLRVTKAGGDGVIRVASFDVFGE